MASDSDDMDAQNSEDNNEETIAELEKKIRELKLKKDLRAGFTKITLREKWKAIFFVFPLLILSLLPPLFVMFDRWFQVNDFVNKSKESWCKVSFFCESLLPPYFIWIFSLLGMISIMMVLFAPKIYEKIEPIYLAPKIDYQTNSGHEGHSNFRKALILIAVVGLVTEIVYCSLFKHIPGMELLIVIMFTFVAIYFSETEISLQKISTQFNGFLKKAPLYGTVIFSQVALIIFLKEITSFSPQKNYIYFLPILFAIAAVIWQGKKISKIFWLFTLAMILYAFRMSSWKFSFIGDEYSFFFYPTQFISHQTFSQIAEQFFNIKGVYDVHPYFSSLITYVSMLFFGNDYFGFHLSNILFMAFLIPMFYDFFKSFINEKVAFIAVIPFAFSHYLINFSKIGYNNLQSLFAMCLILWLANKAIKKRTLSSYFLLGISLGFCFYTFPLGIFTIPLVGLFVLMFDPLRSKAVWVRYLFAFLGLIIIMIPIFYQPYFWSNMAGNTIFFEKNQGVITFSTAIESATHIIHNVLYTSLSYLFIPVESHYVTSSLVDPMLSAFLPLGFLLSIMNFRRNRFLAFLTLSYIFEILILSISNPYDFPALTRMFLLIPFYFVFAILGLDWILRVIAGISYQSGRVYYWMITCVLIISSLLNMIQSTSILQQRTEMYPFQSVILRLFQHDKINYPDEIKSFLFLTDKNFSFYFFETFVDVFHTPESKAQLQQLIVESPQIPDYWIERMKDENLAIIIPNSLKFSLATSLQPILDQTGKASCAITDKSGKYNYYQLWYPQKYPDMCQEAQSLQ